MPSVSPSGRSGGTTMTGWTTDANGNTVFAPTDPLHNGWLVVQAPNGSQANETDAIYLKDGSGGLVLFIACDGGMATLENASSTDGVKHQLGAAVGNSGFKVVDPSNADLLRVTPAGAIGFYGGGPAAQPAASDIAAALAALGLIAAGTRGATLSGGVKTTAITSGALPTIAPVSATAFQCSTTRDVFLTVPVTYNPGVATTATCKVEVSPDNVTFSTLLTITQPVGTVFDGSIEPVTLLVPAAWFVKLTVVNATLGTGTYY